MTSLFWCHIKTNRVFSVQWNKYFHSMKDGNTCTIALTNIHYLDTEKGYFCASWNTPTYDLVLTKKYIFKHAQVRLLSNFLTL